MLVPLNKANEYASEALRLYKAYQGAAGARPPNFVNSHEAAMIQSRKRTIDVLSLEGEMVQTGAARSDVAGNCALILPRSAGASTIDVTALARVEVLQ